MNEEILKFWQKVRDVLREKDPELLFGNVKSVNESERTCSLEVGKVTYKDVRLYSIVKQDLKGVFMVPKKGSVVLASRINGSNELFVLSFSEIDKIIGTIGEKTEISLDEKEFSYKSDKVKIIIKDNKIEVSADEITFNGGDNDGMAKVKKIEENLKSLKDYVEALHAAIPAGIVGIGAGPTAAGAAGKTVYDGLMAGKMVVIKDMENTKIKH